MRWKKALIAVALLVAVLIGAGYAFLAFYDFNKLKPMISQAVKDATGRELIIGGDIDIKLGFIPTILVEGLSFQNAPWGSRPVLAEVKQIEVKMAVLPLLRGQFHFTEFVLLEPDVILEVNQAGTSNFEFETTPNQKQETTLPVLIFSDVRIKRGVFAYKDQRADKTYTVGLERLQAVIPGLDKSSNLDLEGTVDDISFALQGTVGPIAAWIEPGHSFPVDLTARAGDFSFTVKGESRDPIHFKDLSFKIAVEGPSTSEIARLIGMEDIPEFGAFRLAAKLTDPEGKPALEELDIQVGSEELAELKLNGTVRDLPGPRGINLNFSVRGRDVANLAKVGLPPPFTRKPFSASGRIFDPEAKTYTMSELIVVLGNERIRGQLDLNLAVDPPILTANLTSQQFLLGPFTLAVKLIGPADRPAMEKLDLQIGTKELAQIRLNGAVKDLLGLQGVDLDFGIRGKDLANLKELTGKELPVRGAFSGSGKVIISVHKNLKIPELKLVVGKNDIGGSLNLDLSGQKPHYRAVLSSQKLNLQSVLIPEFAELGWVKGLDDLGPAKLAIDLQGFAEALSVEKVDLRVGTYKLGELGLTGIVKDVSSHSGIDLNFTFRGENVADLKKFIGQPLPVAGKYVLSGRITDSEAKTYKASNLKIVLGENSLAGWLDFNLADQWPRIAAELSSGKFNLQPVSTSNAGALANLKTVSDLGPLKLNIKIIAPAGKLSIAQIDLHAGTENLVKVDLTGVVKDLSAQRGLNLNIKVRGNDVASLEKLAGQSLPLQGAFGVSGQLTDHAAKNYKVNNLKLILGDNQISGWLDVNLARKQPQLTTELSAQHFSLEPITLPELESLSRIPDLGPLKLAAKLTSSGNRLAFENLDLHLGSEELAEVSVKGAIADLFALRGFELDFAARGKDLSSIKEVGLPRVPVKGAFRVSGRVLDPAPKIYQIPSLEVSLGDNDSRGSVELNLTGKRPRVRAEWWSEKMDLRPLLVKSDKEAPTESVTKKSRSERDRVFSSEPWNLNGLKRVDANIKIRDRKILLPKLALTDVIIDIMLNNGNLKVKPLKFVVGGGAADGRFNIRSQEQIPTMTMEMKISQLDLGAMLDELGSQRTLEGTLDLDFRLTGQGNSTAEVMAGLNGGIYLSTTDGRAASRYLDLLENFLGTDVLQLLNPFQARTAYTRVNCFVSQIEIEDGLADCKLLLDTNQTSIFSAGDVNLGTERLDFGIRPAPKQGYGRSGVASISFSLRRLSQPFRLGGTLANPSLALDPTGTAFTVGKFAGALALGPVGITAFFSDVSLGKVDPCPVALEALKEAAAKGSRKPGEEKKTRKRSCFFWPFW
ncbi:MAG: AsmA family protein [Deltaproteobacteria bacterium]|nr:MAG: AsmA family protein [Deltaproteobacteria bacterium]